MNAWTNTVITDKGLSLLSKLTQGNTLQITEAVTGAGFVTPGLLQKQTEVSDPKQSLIFRPATYPETGKCAISVVLNNEGLTTGYSATQVGIFATDPDEGKILFFISQAADAASGTIIPSETEMAGYSAEWNFYFQYGQADGVEITVDPANTVSRQEMIEYAAPVPFAITLSGNDEDGYTTDRTFNEIRDAYTKGQELKLFQIFGGPFMVYNLVGIEYDHLIFGCQNGMYYYSVKIYSKRITRTMYRVYTTNSPPTYDVVGAEPLGAVYDHDNSKTAHAGMFAPAGYGYGGSAFTLNNGTKITTEAELDNIIEAVYSKMDIGSTILFKYGGYPVGDYNWFGILSKSSANYGSFVAHSAYGKGTAITKTKYNGTWQPVEWEHPPMIPGVEYRTTERFNGKPVYVRLYDMGVAGDGVRMAHGLGSYYKIRYFAGVTPFFASTDAKPGGSEYDVWIAVEGANIIVHRPGSYAEQTYVTIFYVKE